jgi:hypothetical protein
MRNRNKTQRQRAAFERFKFAIDNVSSEEYIRRHVAEFVAFYRADLFLSIHAEREAKRVLRPVADKYGLSSRRYQGLLERYKLAVYESGFVHC